MKHRISLLLILLGGIILFPLVSQSVRAGLESSTAYIGQPVRYTIQISGTEKADRPELDGFADFSIKSAGESTSMRSSFLNGNGTREVISEFNWLLTPLKLGNLEIPSVSITVDGKEILTRPAQLEVKEPGPLEGYHLFLSVEGENAFPGLPVRLTLKWLFSSQVSQPEFNLPFLDNPDLKIGHLPAPPVQKNDIYQFSINGHPAYATQSAEIYEGEQYASLTMGWDIYPVRSGPLTIEQAIISFKRGVGRDGWGNTKYETAVIPSNSLKITVHEVPEQLKNFSGGLLISKNQMGVSLNLDQNKVYPGDPITAEIRLENLLQPGMTDFEGLQGFSELQELFRVDNSSLITYEEDGTLVIKQTLRARSDRTGEFPALEFLYYNQKTGQIDTVRTDPIDLEIIPIRNTGGTAVLTRKVQDFGESVEESDLLSLNYNATLAGVKNRWYEAVPPWIFLFLPPVLYLMIIFLQLLRDGNVLLKIISFFKRDDSYSRLKIQINKLHREPSMEELQYFNLFIREWLENDNHIAKNSTPERFDKILMERKGPKRAGEILALLEKMDKLVWSDQKLQSDSEISEILTDIRPNLFFGSRGRKIS